MLVASALFKTVQLIYNTCCHAQCKEIFLLFISYCHFSVLNSRHFPKPSTEATAAEFPCKEGSVIQSKGFRNRKSTKENGQENCTLVLFFFTHFFVDFIVFYLECVCVHVHK